MTVPVAFKLLTPEDQHTEENMRLAIIMGWLVELVSQARLLYGIMYSLQFLYGTSTYGIFSLRASSWEDYTLDYTTT